MTAIAYHRASAEARLPRVFQQAGALHDPVPTPAPEWAANMMVRHNRTRPALCESWNRTPRSGAAGLSSGVRDHVVHHHPFALAMGRLVRFLAKSAP